MRKNGAEPASDVRARLAAWIADAGHKGEKSPMRWCAGSFGGDDHAEGLPELRP